MKKTKMKKTFNNHRGCLPAGERVIVISADEKKQEIRLKDPFDIEWIVPMEFVFYPL
jgi:hypothetical protein